MGFFSAARRLGSRFGEPSPTRITPGLPTVRCTTSVFRLNETAGVTVQLPRMLCRIAAAAPGWPSMVAYCADCANRPNKIIAAVSPASTPSGIRNSARPVSSPTTTTIAMIPMPVAATIGSAFGLALRMIPATMPICLRRPAPAGSAAAFFEPASRGLLTMLVMLRVTRSRALTVPRYAVKGLAVEAAGPVGGADQRARHDPGKAQLEGFLAQLVEFLGGHPPVDRVVPDGGPQVLGDREQIAAGGAQVGHGGADLLPLLAEAEDQVGLRDQVGRAGPAEYLERSLVAESGPDPAEDAGHGLDVVREHLGAGGEYLGELPRVRVEVGDEQLHAAARHRGVDGPAGLAVQPGAAVGEVVAGHAGDGRVAQPHRRDRLGDPPRLVGVQRLGPAGGDLAEVTAPGALVAADLERRLAVLPALEDVGAACLLADRVQPLAPDELLQRGVLGPGAQPGLDPGGLALDRRLAVAGLEPQHPAPFRCEYHVPSVRPVVEALDACQRSLTRRPGRATPSPPKLSSASRRSPRSARCSPGTVSSHCRPQRSNASTCCSAGTARTATS